MRSSNSQMPTRRRSPSCRACRRVLSRQAPCGFLGLRADTDSARTPAQRTTHARITHPLTSCSPARPPWQTEIQRRVEAPACGRAEAVYEGLATLVDDAADDAVNHIEKLRRQAKAQLSSHKLKEVRPHSSPSHSRSRSRSRSSRRCALTLALALAVVLALAIAIAPILTQP